VILFKGVTESGVRRKKKEKKKGCNNVGIVDPPTVLANPNKKIISSLGSYWIAGYDPHKTKTPTNALSNTKNVKLMDKFS